MSDTEPDESTDIDDEADNGGQGGDGTDAADSAGQDAASAESSLGHTARAADDDGGDTAESSTDADATAADGDDTAGETAESVGSISEAVESDEVSLREWVDETEPVDVAAEIATLRDQQAELEDAVSELESRLKRKQADFQNYKKRQEKRREDERARATESLVEQLVEVRDNLTRAIDQDDDADIREGVEATFRQLDEILTAEGVEPIEPEPGTAVDPQRHEVLLRVDSDQPPGTVAEVQRPGYEMAGKVLRPAQVTVADEAEDTATTAEGSDT